MKENILVLGGDARQLYAAKYFLDKGYYTEIYGFSQAEDDFGCRKAKSLEEGIDKARVIVLPMPVTRDGACLNAPYNECIIKLNEIYPLLNCEKRVYGGIVNKEFYSSEASVTDYAIIEELILKNALLTAEGTLGMMISSAPFCIKDTKILITGYGRIGKILADYLKALGGDVTVAARKESDFVWCDIKGMKHTEYSDIKEKAKEYKFVVNTVPYNVVTEDMISEISPDCIVIDLASKGGGCDFEALKKRNIKNYHLLGIPGKFSPKSAGEIICDTIIGKEKGLKLLE